ncbi:MAG TPA: HAD hydrolase-like protein [Candidatus Saccharibacteria bacterium]|nr:HAD hydrolase-like protein [Candidatus Saccharibacteria bacterium]
MNIFFDFDGTLADPVDRHYAVYAAVMKEMDGTPLSKHEYWARKRSKIGWDVLLPESGVEIARKAEFLGKFIQLIEDRTYLEIDELLPGAYVTLEALSKHNECYLVSLRRNNDNLLYQLEHLGIQGFFKDILSGHSEADGEDVKSEIIEARVSGYDLVVGDTEADVRAAQLLHIPVAAVTTGIRDYDYLAALQPDYILSSVGELPEIVTSLNPRY